MKGAVIFKDKSFILNCMNIVKITTVVVRLWKILKIGIKNLKEDVKF